jgi:hypothetical protein
VVDVEKQEELQQSQQGISERSAPKTLKVSERGAKISGTLPLSDFAFFVLKTPKNAKSDSDVMSSNFCRSVPKLLDVFFQTFGFKSSNFPKSGSRKRFHAARNRFSASNYSYTGHF